MALQCASTICPWPVYVVHKEKFQIFETLVKYYYPWLPPKCTNCEKWGSYAKACSINMHKTMEEIEALADASTSSQNSETQKQSEEVKFGKQSMEQMAEKYNEDVVIEKQREEESTSKI